MTLTTDTAATPDEHDLTSATDEAPARPIDGPTDEERSLWAAEIDTVIHADPHDAVIQNNVRTLGLKTDKKTVANYQERGINTAVNGYRRDDGVIVITQGQRRVLHAREAGTTVPVWMKQPPTDDEQAEEIKRVFDQLDENDQRVPLTQQDLANAHQYLLDLGVSPTRIAKERGKSRAEIKASLTLAGSELAVKAADRYSFDTLQAADIAWFEEQGLVDEAKRLILTAVEAPNNFKALVRRLRTEHEEAVTTRELTEALRDKLADSGVSILDESDNVPGDVRRIEDLRATPEAEPGTTLTVEEHRSCAGHAARLDTYRSRDAEGTVTIDIAPTYVCRDFRAHGHALSAAPAGHTTLTNTRRAAQDGAEPDAEARSSARIIRNWVIENNKNWDAAVEVRRQWLRDFARRRRAPEGAQGWLVVQKARGDVALCRSLERGQRLARELTRIDDLPAHAATLSGSKATAFDVFLTLAAYEEHLNRNSWRSPSPLASEYMQTLVGWGYDASDVELKVITPEREEDVVRRAKAGQLNEAPDTAGDDGAEAGEADH